MSISVTILSMPNSNTHPPDHYNNVGACPCHRPGADAGAGSNVGLTYVGACPCHRPGTLLPPWYLAAALVPCHRHGALPPPWCLATAMVPMQERARGRWQAHAPTSTGFISGTSGIFACLASICWSQWSLRPCPDEPRYHRPGQMTINNPSTQNWAEALRFAIIGLFPVGVRFTAPRFTTPVRSRPSLYYTT